MTDPLQRCQKRASGGYLEHREAKDEIFWRILKAAMSLDSRKGYLKWTIAELSRSCRVPRPSIYYYFGKSKKDILLSAVQILGEECFGLSPARIKLWEAGDMMGSAKLSRAFLQEHPELISFYFSQRSKDHEIGQALRALEKKHREKFIRFMPSASQEERESFAATLFGMVFMPD